MEAFSRSELLALADRAERNAHASSVPMTYRLAAWALFVVTPHFLFASGWGVTAGWAALLIVADLWAGKQVAHWRERAAEYRRRAEALAIEPPMPPPAPPIRSSFVRLGRRP